MSSKHPEIVPKVWELMLPSVSSCVREGGDRVSSKHPEIVPKVWELMLPSVSSCVREGGDRVSSKPLEVDDSKGMVDC